ncbi:hypothetical protein A5906_26405 [Bradyrhizobium sacchari]|nr:hypothetical protein A5906_26405 [Bradyrhizobium sacchari]
MNFGTTSLAAPHAVSSRVARYSFTARLDVAGSQTFATNQTGHNARLDDMFEYATNDISLAEALIAGPRESRMIRDGILDTELAEPPIGEVHLHFTAEQPLRADREDIPHDQHPDHQLRIDRRATNGRIMRS